MELLRAHMEAVGFWAAVLTTVAFVPQMIRSSRSGSDGVSGTMLLLFGTGVALWFVYGLLRASEPLMLANGLTGLQVIVIAAVKLRDRWRTSRRPATAIRSISRD